MSELVNLLSKLSPLELEAALKEADVLREENGWPKSVNLSVHRDKDSNYETAEFLGLSPEAQDNFRYTASEIILTCEVSEDGTAVATAIKCGDQRLELSTDLRI